MSAPMRKSRSAGQPARTAAESEGPSITAPSVILPVPGLATVRRQTLDEEYADEVFEVEAAKRRARLSDSAGGKIAANDPRKAMLTEHLQGSGRAEGLTSEPTAAPHKIATDDSRRSTLSEHLQATDRARGPASDTAREVTELAAQKKVSPVNKAGKFAEFNKDRLTRGADFDPSKHVEGKRIDREGKAAVEAKLKKMTKTMAHARAQTGTPFESADVVEFDSLVAGEKWADALASLERIETLSRQMLADASEAAKAVLALAKDKVAKAPDCHKPPNATELRQAVQDAYKNVEWLTINRELNAWKSVIEQASKFIDRVADVRRRTDLLKHDTQKQNMARFLTKYQEMTWDEVVATQNKTGQEGSLGYLEDRLKRYEGNTAAADAAAASQQAKIDNGLIGGNGTEIENKGVDKFGGEEKTAIEAALKGLDEGTVPVLTHPNGMKWGEPHSNRAGDLPGTAGAGGYKEYYVQKKPGSATYHGGRRLVVHNKKEWVYYTWKHYGDDGEPAFVRLR